MQQFDAFAVGDTIFVPRITQKEVEMPCPDCLGKKGKWHLHLPSGAHVSIDCLRCGAGDNKWLLPRRYERALQIDEMKINEVSIRCRAAHKGEGTDTTIYYQTQGGGSVYPDKVFTTHEAAVIAGELMLEDAEEKGYAEWEKELARSETRSRQGILAAMSAKYSTQSKAVEDKIDRLKAKMLEAIQYPTLYGPKLSKKSYGAPEITSQSLADWLGELLSEADIDGWTEQEMHEAMCECA